MQNHSEHKGFFIPLSYNNSPKGRLGWSLEVLKCFSNYQSLVFTRTSCQRQLPQKHKVGLRWKKAVGKKWELFDLKKTFEILTWDTKAWKELVTILMAYSSLLLRCHFWGYFYLKRRLADAVANPKSVSWVQVHFRNMMVGVTLKSFKNTIRPLANYL